MFELVKECILFQLLDEGGFANGCKEGGGDG